MKKAIKWTLVLMAGLIIWPAAASAQEETDAEFNQRVDPNGIFDFVDSHKYSNNMNITAVVKKDGATLSDALVAVYASDGIRGKDVAHPEQGNLVFLTVYGEGSVPLLFKVYTEGKIYLADQGLTFEVNGILGMDTPYVITLQNSVLPGDANADGKVDIDDAVAVANHILGQPPITFVKTAADINNDGNITVADAVGIVKMILP